MLTKPNGSVDIHTAMQPVRDALYLRDRAVNLLTSANALAWLHFDAEEGGGEGGVNEDGADGGRNGAGGGDRGGGGGGGGGSDVTSPEFIANGGGSAAGGGGATGGPVGGSGCAGITAMDFDAVAAAAAEVGSEDWPTMDESNERRRVALGVGAARGGARSRGLSAEVSMAVMTPTGRPSYSSSHEPDASAHGSSLTVSDDALLRAAATAVHNAAASSSSSAAAAPYAQAATRPSHVRGASAGAATAQSCDAELESALLGDLHVCDDMGVDTDTSAAGVGTQGLRESTAGNAWTSSSAIANGASAGHGGGSGGANAGRGVARRRFERTEGLLVEKRVWDERGDADVGGGSPKRKQPSPPLPHDTRQVRAPLPAVDRSSEAGLPAAASRGRLSDGGGNPGRAGQQKHPHPRPSSPLPPSPPPTRSPQDAQERGNMRAPAGGPTSPTAGKPGRTELGHSAAAARACGPRDSSHQPSLNAGLFQGTAPPSSVRPLPELAMSTPTKSPAEAAVEAVNAAVAASGDETGLGAEEAGSNCIQS